MAQHNHLAHQASGAYAHVIAHLKSRGFRLTEVRKAIIRYMVETHAHPSADRIYRDLLPQFPNMSLATVYNNLKFLVDEGFVTELKVANDLTTYYDFMGHQHLNIVCENCGKITDFIDEEMLAIHKEVHEQTGYTLTRTQFVLYGLCPDCQSKS